MRKLALMAINVWLSSFLWTELAYAAEFFCPAGNVTCLIAAINEANQNFQDNTINLKAGTYTLTTIDNVGDQFGNQFDGAANGLPVIVGRITIRGQGSSLTRIERAIDPIFADPQFRIFKIQAGAVLNLESLAVMKGFITHSIGGGIVYNLGNLTVSESDISQGIAFQSSGGGGIRNDGTLVVRMSRIFVITE